MATLLIKNAKLVRDNIKEADVFVRDGVITRIGRVDQFRILRMISTPSISGRPRSRITRFGHWELTMLRASFPVRAIRTS